MAASKGQELTTSEIKKLFSESFPELNVDWVHPSDHCDNHSCLGACECALSDRAIFFRISRGRYLVRG